MIETLIPYLVVAVFAVIQSVFGIGILVFGTPTLLLLGYDFVSTLGMLLPASFMVSLFQVLIMRNSGIAVSRLLYVVSMPGICAGLWLAGNTEIGLWVHNLVGVMLLVSAVLRFWPPATHLLAGIVASNLGAYHLVMGVVHGLTNLGGALVAVLAGSTQSEKTAIRYVTAHYYLVFSVIQIAVLIAMTGGLSVMLPGLPMAAISSAVFLTVGNRVFSLYNSRSYYSALTAFMAVYGIVIILR